MEMMAADWMALLDPFQEPLLQWLHSILQTPNVGAPTFSFQRMVDNLNALVTNIELLITAFAFVAGIFMIAKGLMMYRAFGQHITQMSQRGEMAGPAVYILVGAMLVYIPSTINMGLTTIFSGNVTLGTTKGANQLITYSSTSAFTQWQELSVVIVNYLKLLGLIAFIRGWFILSKMSAPGQQPGTAGKGVTHLIGGVLLMNVVDSINIIAATFGFQ